MREDVILQIGAADLAWYDLRLFATGGLVAAGFLIAPWARWHLQEWRIQRATKRGDHEQAEALAFDHEADEPPRSIRSILTGLLVVLIGAPALLVFQINFIAELEHMLGEGWGFLAAMLAMGFLFALGWVVDRIRRNAMSPDELAALEEEEEHRRWMQSIDGVSMPGLIVAIALGIGILTAIYFLAESITPG